MPIRHSAPRQCAPWSIGAYRRGDGRGSCRCPPPPASAVHRVSEKPSADFSSVLRLADRLGLLLHDLAQPTLAYSPGHQGRNLGIFPIIFSVARIRRGVVVPVAVGSIERGWRERAPRPGVVTGAGGLSSSLPARSLCPSRLRSVPASRRPFTFRLSAVCVDVDAGCVACALRSPTAISPDAERYPRTYSI